MRNNVLAKRQIENLLKENLSVNALVQVVPVKGERRTIYQLEGIPLGRNTTIAGLDRLARRIARLLGAELCGLVNVDFVSIGGKTTFDMIAEVSGD